jgi:hypothetical protein
MRPTAVLPGHLNHTRCSFAPMLPNSSCHAPQRLAIGRAHTTRMSLLIFFLDTSYFPRWTAISMCSFSLATAPSAYSTRQCCATLIFTSKL